MIYLIERESDKKVIKFDGSLIDLLRTFIPNPSDGQRRALQNTKKRRTFY